MIVDSLYEDFGGLQLPVAADAFSTNLTPLDPARSVLANLFAAAVNAELGAAWTKVVSTLPKDHELYGTKPVEDVLELPPNADTLGQVKVKWPLLAIHRAGDGTYDEYTLFNDRLTQTWNVHYILGPSTIAEERKLGDACVAAAKIIRGVIRLGGHPAFQGGAVQFFDDKAALSYVNLKSQEGPGQAQFVKDEAAALYYAITLTLETWEVVRENLDGYDGFNGVDFSIGLANSEGDTIPDFIEAQTDPE